MKIQLRQINSKSNIIYLMLILVSSWCLTAYQSFQPPSPIQPKTIFILRPSTGSSLLSPISLQAEISCQPNSFIRIEIIDGKRNLLYRQLIRPDCEISHTLNLNESIYFKTNIIDTPTRLTISLLDNSSRFLAISSVDLTLSTENQLLLHSPINKTDFLILNPLENSLTQGGSLFVSGWINPTNSSPLILELTLESGKLIGSRQILIQDNPLQEYQYFEVDLPYIIPGIQSVKLTIRQVGEKISGNVSLESHIVQLGP